MNIKTVLNYTIVPPIKMIVFLLALVPVLWLIFGDDSEYKSFDIIDAIMEFKLR